MTTLYIIGNGFDLFHDLSTRYKDYRSYLEKNNPEAKKSFEESPLLRDIPREDGRWSDVERALQLGRLNRLFLDALEAYQPSLADESPAWDDSQFYIGAKTRFIKDFSDTSFNSWIASIDLNDVTSKVLFDKDALFVSFNYTKLLEKQYGINDERILHIHGACNGCSETTGNNPPNGPKLQFGSPENDAHKLRKALEHTCTDNAFCYPDESYYGVWIEPCIKTLEETCRSVEKRLSDNFAILHQFLSGIAIDNICIFGHSYDRIDYPYYQDILIPMYRDLPWTFVDYGANKKSAVKHFCFENGISRYEAVDDYGIVFLDLSHLPLSR